MATVKPYEKNAKKHPKKQIEQILREARLDNDNLTDEQDQVISEISKMIDDNYTPKKEEIKGSLYQG